MSYHAVDVALDVRTRSHAGHLVLICLARHYNARDGKCFPSYERIAEKMNLSKSSVARAIKELEEDKQITKRKSKRRGTHEGPNHYRLNFYIEARLIERDLKRRSYGADDVPMVGPKAVTTSPSDKSSGKVEAPKKRPRSQKRRPERLIAEDWKPTEVQRAKAVEIGLPDAEIDYVAETFSLYWGSRGAVRANWGLSWYIWVRNELNYRKQEAANGRSRNSAAGAGPRNRGDDLERLHRAVMAEAEERRRREGGGQDGAG